MSVSHFSLETAAWKSQLMRFSDAGLISPGTTHTCERLPIAMPRTEAKAGQLGPDPAPQLLLDLALHGGMAAWQQPEHLDVT